MNRNERYEFSSSSHRLIGYPYRVWIFSIFISPFLIVLWSIISSDDALSFGYSFFYFVWLALSLIFLFPAGLIYMLIFWTLINSGLSKLLKKIILAFSGIGALFLVTVGISLVFDGQFDPSSFLKTCFFLFAATFFILSLLFPLKETN
jgi:hypothetical protein